MPKRKKYPDAQEKKDYYSNLASSLKSSKTTIENELTTAENIGDSGLAQNVDGDYYNRYIIKRNDWIDIHSKSIEKFKTFLSDIDICITNANNLSELWAGRIEMEEEY